MGPARMPRARGGDVTGAHHDAELNFDGQMGYGDYLALDRVLDAQHPLSGAHDEAVRTEL